LLSGKSCPQTEILPARKILVDKGIRNWYSDKQTLL
jgi:hypothetical protein